MSDTFDILTNLKAGKESALRDLYRSFFYPLCAFGNRFVKEREVVADIVQEVFIKVWERRTNFDAIYLLRSFMYVSVRNACLNYNRDQLKIHKLELNEAMAENMAEAEESWVVEEEVHRMIRDEIERLPQAVKNVINLTLQNLSVAEIAQLLNISENTVRNQRARGREILRSKLGDKLFFLFF